MPDIIGTNSSEILNGSANDDVIWGNDGDDIIHGGEGNDAIWGGQGNDRLYGDAGNDTLHGEAGDDHLLAQGGGNESLDGGLGNDILQIQNVDTAPALLNISGGEGRDMLFYFAAVSSAGGEAYIVGNDTLIASLGAGDDRADLRSGQAITLDAGTGDDVIFYPAASPSVQLTLGEGRDILGPLPSENAPGAVLVTDFQSGTGSDRLVLDFLIASYDPNWNGANPFGLGMLRLVQSGSDTLLQFDNPSDALNDFVTIATLTNVSATALIQENLGFAPDGSVSVARTVTAPNFADSMLGEAGDDTITGADGNDHIEGFAGNDSLLGSLGNDGISGGIGNDVIDGGGGNDELFDAQGNDTLLGGAGDDGLYAFREYPAPAAALTLDGGAGRDYIQYWSSKHETDAVTLIGGDGDDQIFLGLAASASIDGGSGNDQIEVDLLGGAVTVTLGEGNDFLVVTQSPDATHGQLAPIVVTDFRGTAGWDALHLDQVMASRVIGWNGTDNPFTSGYLRLVQMGPDTLVQIDRSGGADSFETFLRLLGTQPDTLIDAQYDMRFEWRPDRIFVTGTDGADTLSGDVGNDGLIGLDGADSLSGGSGRDYLIGDAGDDTLIGGLSNDTLDGGAGVDTAILTGNRADYVINQLANGKFSVFDPTYWEYTTDTLSNIEYLQFADQTVRLRPGSGTAVDFAADPASYMAGIRDFDGNDLGGAGGWKLIGSADVNGDGDADHIPVNRTIARFAELGTAPDGNVWFGDHGWAGETRVVGIYIDPLVQSGEVTQGGDHDSQRRFQNDLAIENINRVLGAGDYDRDGLQEVYFGLTDGTAYLHAYMHADGNIRYANYQSQQQVIDYLAGHGWAASTYDGWFG